MARLLIPNSGHSGIYRVSKIYKDKADGPVLNVKKVTVLLSISVKG